MNISEHQNSILDIPINSKISNRNKGARVCNKVIKRKDSEGKEYSRRVFCNSWTCYRCGKRNTNQVKTSIIRYKHEKHLIYHLTLTLDPAKIPEDSCPFKYIKYSWKKFSVYLKRNYRKPISYILILECHLSGMPHLHVLINRRIPISKIQKHWEANGGGSIIKSEKITDIEGLSKYLVKYLCNNSTPNYVRRVSSSRDIVLFPKDPDILLH